MIAPHNWLDVLCADYSIPLNISLFPQSEILSQICSDIPLNYTFKLFCTFRFEIMLL